MDHRYKKFLTVVQSGSFSAAAKKLRVSQPAITIAIASLEHSLKTKLIIRNRRTIQLTPDGEIVYASAQRIAKETESMKALLSAQTDKPVAQVGLIDSIAHLLYTSPKDSPVLANVEVMVDNSMRIINDLVSGALDAGFITGQPKPLSANISTYKLEDEKFVFVSAPTNISEGPISVISDWLAFNQDSTTYAHFMREFVKNNLSVTPTFYSTSMELLRDMAVAGNGTALLPLHFVQSLLDSGKLAVVQTVPLRRPIWLIARKNTDQSTIFDQLVRRVNDMLARP